jgi:hypothetical protein
MGIPSCKDIGLNLLGAGSSRYSCLFGWRFAADAFGKDASSSFWGEKAATLFQMHALNSEQSREKVESQPRVLFPECRPEEHSEADICLLETRGM